MEKVRYMGVDYGHKKVGIAISERNSGMAFPYCILDNNDMLVEKIIGIIEEEGVGAIVIGKSVDGAGKKNKNVMSGAEKLARQISEKKDIEIFFEDEFYSTVDALESHKRLYGKYPKGRVDDKSAAIILQNFLDYN